MTTYRDNLIICDYKLKCYIYFKTKQFTGVKTLNIICITFIIKITLNSIQLANSCILISKAGWKMYGKHFLTARSFWKLCTKHRSRAQTYNLYLSMLSFSVYEDAPAVHIFFINFSLRCPVVQHKWSDNHKSKMETEYWIDDCYTSFQIRQGLFSYLI